MPFIVDSRCVSRHKYGAQTRKRRERARSLFSSSFAGVAVGGVRETCCHERKLHGTLTLAVEDAGMRAIVLQRTAVGQIIKHPPPLNLFWFDNQHSDWALVSVHVKRGALLGGDKRFRAESGDRESGESECIIQSAGWPELAAYVTQLSLEWLRSNF